MTRLQCDWPGACPAVAAGGTRFPLLSLLDWVVFFAYIAAIIVATRSFLSLRLAAFDACVIVAAGLAVGAAFVGRGLGDEVTAASLSTLNRPILGIVTLMLIVSAALGSWEGLPRSIALL